MTTDIKERLRDKAAMMAAVDFVICAKLNRDAADYIEQQQIEIDTLRHGLRLANDARSDLEAKLSAQSTVSMTAQELASRMLNGEKWKLAGTEQALSNSNVQKVHIAPTSANFARVQTDEQIEKIWNSLGYRTKFAPYMLRLVRAVLVLIDVAPLQVQDERIAQLERLLTRAKNHIVDWWRPDGSLPPAKSPDLVEDIEAALNPGKGAPQ